MKLESLEKIDSTVKGITALLVAIATIAFGADASDITAETIAIVVGGITTVYMSVNAYIKFAKSKAAEKKQDKLH